ncbi:MAG: ABC transporter permease [Rhodospirillaceae bacterium]|nr:ABC transporter permease [Rhodospirillaceae bacterium]MCA8934085.1 ABC transporter permease [Rhodospirillaceae bacterium]
MTSRLTLVAVLAPAVAFAFAFFLLPLGQLVLIGASGEEGLASYWRVVSDTLYLTSLANTVLLAGGVTLATLTIAAVVGPFLAQNRFFGRSLLVALLTFPLAFPGVVVGFLVILTAGRQGLINEISRWLTGDRLVFAYSLAGLFFGYLYFSIPRVVLTVMAAADKLDRATIEAARSLGASPLAVARDVVLPALKPAFIASGAICFATAMGAFGTAFTLATDITVLPMTIYTEFTLGANLSMAAALSVFLGLVTWLVLLAARRSAGATVAAAG